MSEEIKVQLEFVEWLKNQGMYNPMESARTIDKMFRVFVAVKKSRDPESQNLKAENKAQSDAIAEQLKYRKEDLDKMSILENYINSTLRIDHPIELEAENKKLREALERTNIIIRNTKEAGYPINVLLSNQ